MWEVIWGLPSVLSFPWDWSLLLSPSVLSPVNLCVTIASGQPPVWLCSPLVWSSTLVLMKATSQALEGKEGSPGRTALQRNTKGDIASTVPRDRQLLQGLWDSSSLSYKRDEGEFIHSFLTNT